MPQVALFDLSHHGKIEAVGKDALSFLHNLSTADIKNLKPGDGCEAFLATAKAKAVAFIQVFRQHPEGPPALRIDAGPGRGEAVFKHLDHFLISEQVELADRTADFAQFFLNGPNAPAVLAKLVSVAPWPDGLGTQSLPWLEAVLEVRRRIEFREPALDVLCPTTIGRRLWQALLDAGAEPAGLDAYEILRIEAGLPAWGAELDENRSVFEVGVNQRAICYTKGCYLGQEPIVMARDRGHINRTLLGLRISGDAAVPVGSKVLHAGQEIGQVTSSAVSPPLGAIALAYLKRGSQDAGLAVKIESGSAKVAAAVTPLPIPM